MKTFDTLSKTVAFHAATSSVDLGNAGERLAIALFRDSGYSAKKIESRYSGDLRVLDARTGEIFNIEVKIARQSTGKRKRWQFCMNKQGFTSCSYSDMCLLIAVLRGRVVCYLIPACEISGIKNIEISHPDKYRGRWKRFQISDIEKINNMLRY